MMSKRGALLNGDALPGLLSSACELIGAALAGLRNRGSSHRLASSSGRRWGCVVNQIGSRSIWIPKNILYFYRIMDIEAVRWPIFYQSKRDVFMK